MSFNPRGRGGSYGRGGRGGRQVRPTHTAQLRSTILLDQRNSVRRLQKDLKELRDCEVPLVGVSAAPLDDSIFTWHANIRAPAGTAYQGAVFHLEMSFPSDYPCSPPSITLLVPNIQHPNVFGQKLCLDMLEPNQSGKWYEGWNSAYTIEAILIQLQSFFFVAPKRKAKGAITDDDLEDTIKAVVDAANAYKCSRCKHRGPIEPYPPFNSHENDESAFCFVRDPLRMIEDELLCFHSRTPLSESTLGIGVSMQRLPRTGEIRSVNPSLDLLCLRAFQKQNVRKSIDGDKFSHWLPLYFGETKPYEKKTQRFNDETKEYETEVKTINPRDRIIHLLKKSLAFLTKKDTRKELTAEMVIEVMPKLITTHLVEMVNENKFISLVAIRRLVNFIRLFRLLMELKPDVNDIVDSRLKSFKEQPEKRVKDHCSALGDILSFATISNNFKLTDVLDAYLEEQLDRQAFWIIKQIPELDHTDEKFKGKEVILEASRNEVCFKTGLSGFHITMIFFTICNMIETQFKRNFNDMCKSLDENFGCLPADVENRLQTQLKAIKKIDNFNKYYQWLQRDCPDAQALALRLRQAITNSKAKRYHGDSAHMNELPTLKEQAKNYLMAEPSPFSHYNEETKEFLSDNDPFWIDACKKKFEWVFVSLKDTAMNHNASSLAAKSDQMHLTSSVKIQEIDPLLKKHSKLQHGNWSKEVVSQQTVQEDYPENFSYKQLFHKLCFEQMLENLSTTCDFELMYEFIQKIGPSVHVLRVATIDKTHLKSNNYWLMALLGKMPALRVLKLHKPEQGQALSKDGYKFLMKGLTYMKQNGRHLQKIQFNNLLGDSAEMLYPCLKLHEDIQILKFTNLSLNANDTKAIGKVLADFKNIRELDLTNSKCNDSSIKDIADGLMRAKQLEIIKLGNNPSMGKSVNSVIYNLAFSPKIRYIDLSDIAGTDRDTAEALFKLINISGSIESLVLANSSVLSLLTEDFYKSVGQSKTLKYLNLDSASGVAIANHLRIGQCFAMNAKLKGALVAVSMANWFNSNSAFNLFLAGLKVSDQDAEYWYGDKNLARNMQKEQLVKVQHFAIKYFNIGGLSNNLNGVVFKPKAIAAQPQPEWPDFLHLAARCDDLNLNLSNAKFRSKDMELFAYAIGENPIGQCKIQNLNLSKSPIHKEGAKLLAPALALNKSLIYLDLSSTKIGVSGIVRMAEALQKNTTLKSINLYRNILDVDGARSIGNLLKVNSTIEFIDVGHNRIRQTGLRAICDGILSNPDSKLTQLGIRANFINDDGINHLFEKLILPVYSGRKQQLTQVFMKSNFLSEYLKINLAKQVRDKNIDVLVDVFRAVDYLVKEKLDRSIWISPVTASQSCYNIREVLQKNECGYITDVRIATGKKTPGRPQENRYVLVEFADENSVARSLKLASIQKAYFGGIKVRIFRSGTQTAIVQPSQKRRQ